jgi:hypothetical protein
MEKLLPSPAKEIAPVPTDLDYENARVRRAIADRMEAEYIECLAWAQAAFGPGWRPSHRHFLVSLDEEERVRYTSERVRPSATVYTVRNDAREARHFTIDNGKVVEHTSYQEGFGPMLFEPHPTRGFEHKGQWCPYHRYSLCWAGYDLYEPKTAEELAALRASRERKKTEREEKKFAEEHPLWVGLDPDS